MELANGTRRNPRPKIGGGRCEPLIVAGALRAAHLVVAPNLAVERDGGGFIKCNGSVTFRGFHQFAEPSRRAICAWCAQ